MQNQEQLSTFQAEPAKVIGAISALASAVIGLLIVLGIAVPDGLDQQVQTVIHAFGLTLMSILPLLAGWRIRQEVVPIAKLPDAERDETYPVKR